MFQEVQLQLEVVPKAKHGTKEFDFANMLKCGSCGSGVTAEEKFKKIRSDGSVRRYVYYHYNRFKDYHCKEAYIREETLITELLKIIDKVNLDEVGTLKKMKQEVERYKKFNALISKVNNQEKINHVVHERRDKNAPGGH